MKYTTVAVAFLLFAARAEAKDHTVHLHIENIGSDPVGWHFSQYFGHDQRVLQKIADAVGVPLPNFVKSLPIGQSIFEKKEHQDDPDGRMQPGWTFDKEFGITGPGVFILDFF